VLDPSPEPPTTRATADAEVDDERALHRESGCVLIDRCHGCCSRSG
jgi:hypothetical protein